MIYAEVMPADVILLYTIGALLLAVLVLLVLLIAWAVGGPGPGGG